MPKTARVAPGGLVYHVLNRSVGRMHMFRKESAVEAFERVMVEAHLRPIRILSWSGR
jgi:putative transposase